MKSILLTIVLSFFVISCDTSYRKLAQQDNNETTYFYSKNLEGTYENAVPGNDKVSLWQDLYMARYNKYTASSAYRTHVELEMLTDKKVQATLYRNNIAEDSLILKGKVKGKYFVVRRRSTVVPLFPLLMASQGTKSILGNDLDGNLTLVQGVESSSEIPILNMPETRNADFVTAVYQRK